MPNHARKLDTNIYLMQRECTVCDTKIPFDIRSVALQKKRYDNQNISLLYRAEGKKLATTFLTCLTCNTCK